MPRSTPIILTLALLAAGCVSPALEEQSTDLPDAPAGPVLGAYDGLRSPEDVVAELADLQVRGVQVAPIGASVEDRPLHLASVGEGPLDLWVAARHHGNEPTGTEAAMNMLQYLTAEDPVLAEDVPPIVREVVAHRATVLDRVTIHIVPVVNPDGAAAFTRGNARGVDLNRDYAVMSQPETRAVAAAYWTVRADVGLDLHNEGLGSSYDYDAYYPEVPRIEAEIMADLLADQWRTVHEVDAAGGFAGGPNENYKLAANVSNVVAYWPGTHDAFLALRGAPAWTPEGAIADEATYPWSVRLHEVTLATALADVAGLDGETTVVTKHEVDVGDEVTFTVTDADRVRVQAVWQDLAWAPANGHDVDVTITTPSGDVVGPDRGLPATWTETHDLQDPEPGTYTVQVTRAGGAPADVELRIHQVRERPAPVTVERVDGALQVRSKADAPVQVRVTDTLTGQLVDTVGLAPGNATVTLVEGNLEPRTLVTWDLTLQPGETRELRVPASPGADVGPWRAVVDGDEPLLLVGNERSAPAG